MLVGRLGTLHGPWLAVSEGRGLHLPPSHMRFRLRRSDLTDGCNKCFAACDPTGT